MSIFGSIGKYFVSMMSKMVMPFVPSYYCIVKKTSFEMSLIMPNLGAKRTSKYLAFENEKYMTSCEFPAHNCNSKSQLFLHTQ